MATVTRKFSNDFDLWAAQKIASGEWSAEDIEGLKQLLRIDFTPGADQLRAGLTIIDAAGIERPAMIDDHEERYRLWAEFFTTETIQQAPGIPSSQNLMFFTTVGATS